MENIESRVKNIEDRNKRVELDKKWEKSFARIFSVSLITYFVAVLSFYVIKAPHPFFNAFIPTIGFILSTQSLPFIKRKWMKNR